MYVYSRFTLFISELKTNQIDSDLFAVLCSLSGPLEVQEDLFRSRPSPTNPKGRLGGSGIDLPRGMGEIGGSGGL